MGFDVDCETFILNDERTREYEHIPRPPLGNLDPQMDRTWSILQLEPFVFDSTRVRDDDVQAPELRNGFLNQFLASSFLSHISLNSSEF